MADEFDTTPASGSGKASGAGQGVEGKSGRTDDSDSGPSAVSLGGPASEVVKSSNTKGPTLTSSSFLFSHVSNILFSFLLIYWCFLSEILKFDEICLCCWVEADCVQSTYSCTKLYKRPFV